jgi:hypothetical protein
MPGFMQMMRCSTAPFAFPVILGSEQGNMPQYSVSGVINSYTLYSVLHTELQLTVLSQRRTVLYSIIDSLGRVFIFLGNWMSQSLDP